VPVFYFSKNRIPILNNSSNFCKPIHPTPILGPFCKAHYLIQHLRQVPAQQLTQRRRLWSLPLRSLGHHPNDTVVTTVGPTITDSLGKVWAITPTEQVSLNGTVILYTSHVIELAYVNGTVWQRNASGNWYSFIPTGALGIGPTITSPFITSPNDTVVTAVGPSITDSASNVWKLTTSRPVSLNGTVISRQP
jgi:hypothetical protein